jgi:hypothetical protein
MVINLKYEIDLSLCIFLLAGLFNSALFDRLNFKLIIFV